MNEQNEPVSEGPEPPKTMEEARAFHSGYLAGATAYARESGHSTLVGKNDLLRKLIAEHGWKTIETFEQIQAQGSTP